MVYKIVIATGIYPPQPGGPAQYAKKLFEIWKSEGHSVVVKKFAIENRLPTGIRHIFYFLRILPAVARADFVMITDTFSAAVPAVLAGKIFRTPTIIRTGGDFLWEWYVERTKKKVLLREFYKTSSQDLNFVEKLRFYLIKWSLQRVDVLTFSTAWQRDIFIKPYGLEYKDSIFVVENYYGKAKATTFELINGKRIIYSVSRPLVWKNNDVLRTAVILAQEQVPDYELIETPMEHEAAMDLMDKSYIVALTSLGDISSNMILEAIRAGKPFVITRENGLYDRIGDISISIDPLNPEEIAKKLVWLADPSNYSSCKKKVENFNFVRDWNKVADDFMKACIHAMEKRNI